MDAEAEDTDTSRPGVEAVQGIASGDVGEGRKGRGKGKGKDSRLGRCQVCFRSPLGTFSRAQTLTLAFPVAFVYILGFQMYNVAIYPISVYYGVSTTIAQLFAVSQNIINTAFCFLSSTLVKRFGMRRIVILCFFAGGVLNLAMPWGPFIYSLLVRIVAGFLYAFIGPTRSPIIRVMIVPEKFRAAMSLNTSLTCISAVVSPLLAGIFCDSKFSWFGIPVFIGALSLLSSLYFLLGYPKVPKPQAPAAPSTANVGEVTPRRSLFVNPQFDVFGCILLVSLVLSLCIALIEFSVLPLWALISLFGLFVLSVVLYVVHERHLKSGRIIPFEIFKNKRLVLNLIVSSVTIGSLRVPSILAPMVMQQAYRISSTITGFINAITIPLGQLLGGIFLSLLIKKVRPHMIFTVTLFINGLCDIAMCVCMILSTPIPLVICQFLTAYCAYTVSSIGGQNSMLFADPSILAITSCVHEMSTSLGGVLGQFVAVTVRDMLTPHFSDPTTPLGGEGIKVASMVSGIIIAAAVLLCTPLAYLTGRLGQKAPAPIIQSAAISVTPAGGNSDSEISIEVVGGIDEIREGIECRAIPQDLDVDTDTDTDEEDGTEVTTDEKSGDLN